MRVLTPTENRRLNEMVGFVGITVSVLIFLALVSYNPHDASFNVSAPAPDAHSAVNWIGPVGAYGADLLFQFLGYAVFLLPVVMFILSWRWFRSQPVESPITKIVGCSMLGFFVPALLSLWHWPEVRGAIPPGGMFGHLVASGLLAAFNTVGANLVALAAFLVSLFLTTRFSFEAVQEWASVPLKKLDPVGRVRDRWAAWREEREKTRMKKRLVQNKTVGRQPVPAQASGPGTLLLKSATSIDADIEEEEQETRSPIE
ncbi:MAG: DNA translocase FtsK 4TM domain-containing protein, partial [Candidatus Acidiferrales bacterium]